MGDLEVSHTVGRSVTVASGAQPLFTYVYTPDTPQLESPKPYLHPVHTLAGELVTTFRPHDHVWHKGIAWSLPHVGEHNFWGGPTFTGGDYAQLENNGSAVHRELVELTAGESAALVHDLDWFTQQGAKVVDERRSLTASIADAGTWVLVFSTTMTNVSGGTLAFGSATTKGRENAGYAGLFWRGPRSFTGGLIQSPTATGGDDLRGTRAEWFAFRGQHDGSGASSTILVVDDTANPRHEPEWFARTEQFACLNPAPFFSEELDLPHGSALTFRYAVVVAAGDHGDNGTAALADFGREALR